MLNALSIASCRVGKGPCHRLSVRRDPYLPSPSLQSGQVALWTLTQLVSSSSYTHQFISLHPARTRSYKLRFARRHTAALASFKTSPPRSKLRTMAATISVPTTIPMPTPKCRNKSVHPHSSLLGSQTWD